MSEDLVPTRLTDLLIGDKVQIKHAHTCEAGYFKDWTKSNYEYIGIENNQYVFRNVNYAREKFTMKNNIESGHILIGKFTNTSKTV